MTPISSGNPVDQNDMNNCSSNDHKILVDCHLKLSLGKFASVLTSSFEKLSKENIGDPHY